MLDALRRVLFPRAPEPGEVERILNDIAAKAGQIKEQTDALSRLRSAQADVAASRLQGNA